MTTIEDATTLPKLGIVAGGGELPILLAEACRTSGRPYHVLLLETFADEADYAEDQYGWTTIGAPGKTAEKLLAEGCVEMVMAGHVRRPNFKSIKLDWRGTKLLPKLMSAAKRGDDALLSIVVEAMEEDGLKVVGADDVLGHLLIEEGPLGNCKPSEDDLADIKRGIEVVQSIGALDIGQCAVICNQLVLAIEAVEGTDQMMKRCLDIETDLRGTPEERRGVLVKIPKPGQERRVDLPTVGVETIERAIEIGLSGIAIAAGGALVLNAQRMTDLADKNGIFITGIKVD